MTAKYSYRVDCTRQANTRTIRCDLHDAIVMSREARELQEKATELLTALERKDREVDHCEPPCAPPPEEDDDDGVIICARCDRELKSLEQIRAALELAPGEAAGELLASPDRSFALGRLTEAIVDAVRDLACHTGACHRGML